MSRAPLLAAACLLVACGSSGSDGGAADAAPSADADLTPRADAAPAICFVPTIDADVALTIQIEEACAIWNSLSVMNGQATIARDGDALTLDFGDGVIFTGTVTGDAVSLSYVHPHDFTDGCGWQASETLAGTLDGGTCALALTYQYVEAVVVDNGACATPCSAQADVSLVITPVDVE